MSIRTGRSSPHNPLASPDRSMATFRVGQRVRTTGKGRTATWIEKGETKPTVYFGRVTQIGIVSIWVKWDGYLKPDGFEDFLPADLAPERMDSADVEPMP